MRCGTASVLAIAGILCTAGAQSSSADGHMMVATSWTESGCTGTSDVLYTDVSTSYCFNTGGASFNNVAWEGGYCLDGIEITTFSGADCEGSSFISDYQGNPAIGTFSTAPGYENPNNTCVDVPYASVQLFCLV